MDKLDLQAAVVPATCERHGAYDAHAMTLAGRRIQSGCPACAEAEQAAQLEDQRRERMERQIAQSGIPRRFLDRTLDTYRATEAGQKRALQIARGLVQAEGDGASAVFCGAPGTGKTHLGCAVCRAFIERGRSARFVTVLAALRSIKDTYRRDSETSERAALAAFTTPDMLVLDEVGVQLGTEHEKMLLFEIINERYQECRATVLISNLNRQEIGEYLGQRVMDRFADGGAVVAFGWASYRGRRP